jgi:hypothetical protein
LNSSAALDEVVADAIGCRFLGRGPVEIQRMFAAAAYWFAKVSSELRRALGVALVAVWIALVRARSAAGERFADVRWRVKDRTAERAERLRTRSNELRAAGPPRERLALAWWQVRKSALDLAEAARLFRLQHRRASTVALLCLLLSLALAGTGAAVLADTGSSATGTGNSTDYIVVTGAGGTRTYAVTITSKGKKQTILRVVRRPGGTTTLSDTVSVDGPIQVLPGQTKTITKPGSVRTVTVSSPPVTVTQTEVTTETVTVVNEVTVTEEIGPPPMPSP